MRKKFASLCLAAVLIVIIMIPTLAAGTPGTNDLHITLTIDTDPIYELTGFASATDVRFFCDYAQDIVDIRAFDLSSTAIYSTITAKTPGAITLAIQERFVNTGGNYEWRNIGAAHVTVVNPSPVADREIDVYPGTYYSFPEYALYNIEINEIGYPKILYTQSTSWFEYTIQAREIGTTHIQILAQGPDVPGGSLTWTVLETVKVNVKDYDGTSTETVSLSVDDSYTYSKYANDNIVLNLVSDNGISDVANAYERKITGYNAGKAVFIVQKYTENSLGARFYETVDVIKVTVIEGWGTTPPPQNTPAPPKSTREPQSDSSSSDSLGPPVGPSVMNITAYGPSAQSLYANSTMVIDPSYLARPGETTRVVDNSGAGIVAIDGHTVTAKHRGYAEVLLEVYDPEFDRWIPLTAIQVTVLSGEFAPPPGR